MGGGPGDGRVQSSPARDTPRFPEVIRLPARTSNRAGYFSSREPSRAVSLEREHSAYASALSSPPPTAAPDVHRQAPPRVAFSAQRSAGAREACLEVAHLRAGERWGCSGSSQARWLGHRRHSTSRCTLAVQL